MNGSRKTMGNRATSAKDALDRRRAQLEKNRLVNFPLATLQRFKEIEGSRLALIIGANVFIAVIPLLIIGYAFIEAFNPNRSVGTVLVGRFHLTGATADTVRATFSTAENGKSVALSIGLISLLITGLDVSGTVGTAYARAFQVTAPQGWRRFARGAIWLGALLVMTSVSLTIRYWASSRPWWFLPLLAPIGITMTFCFYLVTPRVVLHLPFRWRDLVPGAIICTVVAAALNVASTFVLASWFQWYGSAYGSFGVALALMSWIGIVAIFWMLIASAQGVYWERRAEPAEVLAMEQESEDRNAEDRDDDVDDTNFDDTNDHDTNGHDTNDKDEDG
jgi:membrane protein